MGTCTKVPFPCNHLPQFYLLELQTSMGDCPGQYMCMSGLLGYTQPHSQSLSPVVAVVWGLGMRLVVCSTNDSTNWTLVLQVCGGSGEEQRNSLPHIKPYVRRRPAKLSP